MSDQSRKTNEETQGHEAPGRRLAKREALALTPAQAQKQKEKRVMIIMIIVAVIMVAAAAVVLLINRWFVKPDLPPAPGPSSSSAPKQSDDPLMDDPAVEETLNIDAIQPKVGGERKSKDIYTVLIFGTDTTSGLTDSMMVATYDVTNQKATVMSLPRDTLINSSARPGINAKKLNAVYKVYGNGASGTEALKNEVSELVGFVPDYYVKIDWDLVGEMVDAIGGVWFDNPYHMEYYDPYQDLNIYQEKGYRKVNGNDAMQIVRWRHNGKVNGVTIPGGGNGSDISRLEVQHAFLKAVLKQTLQIDKITKIGSLIELFNSRVDSDLSVENMLWFAQSAVFGGLQVDDVDFCTMPTYLGLYGKESFVYPVQSELLAIINESLNPYQEQVTIRQLDLMSTTGDGALRSSTGRLAEPSLGFPPVTESEDPEESDNPDEDDPDESDDPQESGIPQESGEPQESDPVTTDPASTEPDPVQAGELSGQLDEPPAQTDEPPAQTDEPPAQTKPGWLGSVSEPAAAGGPDNGDWGNTPD